MIDKNRIADPTTHYGPAKHATKTFIRQRLSGALNVLFLIFFAWLVVRLAGAERAEMVSVIANPSSPSCWRCCWSASPSTCASACAR